MHVPVPHAVQHQQLEVGRPRQFMFVCASMRLVHTGNSKHVEHRDQHCNQYATLQSALFVKTTLHGTQRNIVLATGVPVAQTVVPGSSSASKLDKIAEAAAAAVMRKQTQVPVVAGVVKSANAWDTSGDISVTIFPACKAHAHVPGSCCSQVCHLTVRPCFNPLFALALVALELAATPQMGLCATAPLAANTVHEYNLLCSLRVCSQAAAHLHTQCHTTYTACSARASA